MATLQQLIDALAKASPGQVVFVDGSARIDCSVPVHIEGLKIVIPKGVTLASDRGHGYSRGALIYSKTMRTYPLVECGGPNVRITGIRLRGPDTSRRMGVHKASSERGKAQGIKNGWDSKYYYSFPTSQGILCNHDRLEIDNCELAGWSETAIYLRAGTKHHVHHNSIHHNQRNSLGYGVSHGAADSLVEYNIFNRNRHSLAGTGGPGCSYEARHNVQMKHSLSHSFDMHGGRDRLDGTTVAGTWMKIHHNTFMSFAKPVQIRGIPQEGATVNNNWFHYHRANAADYRKPVATDGKTDVFNNAYGTQPATIQDPEANSPTAPAPKK